MSAQALLDLSDRRPARRPGTRRAQKRPSAPLTRNALIADYLALCELDAEVESLRAPEEEEAQTNVIDQSLRRVASGW